MNKDLDMKWDERWAKIEERNKIPQPDPPKWMMTIGGMMMGGHPFGRPYYTNVFCSKCDEPLGKLRLDSDEGTRMSPCRIYCKKCWKKVKGEYSKPQKSNNRRDKGSMVSIIPTEQS